MKVLTLTVDLRDTPLVYNSELAAMGLKVKKAADFMYSAKFDYWQGGDENQAMFFRLWEQARAPFAIPKSICTHTKLHVPGTLLCPLQEHSSSPQLFHRSLSRGVFSNTPCDGNEAVKGAFPTVHSRSTQMMHTQKSAQDLSSWEVFDADLAGCLLCGSLHICKPWTCPVEKSPEGHEICVITGMCVKLLSISNEEFLDTACYSSSGCKDAAYEFVDDLQGYSFQDCDDADSAGVGVHHAQGHGRCAEEDLEEEEATRSRACKRAAGNGTLNASCSSILQRQQLPTSRRLGLQDERGKPGAQAAVVANPRQQQNQHYLAAIRQRSFGNNRCSVNKKNRYRSWVYHRVMQQPSPVGSGVGNHRGHQQQQQHQHHHHVHSQSHEYLNPAPPPPLSQSDRPNAFATPTVHSRSDVRHFHHQQHHQRIFQGRNNHGGTSAASHDRMDDAGHVGALIQSFLEDVLCSSKWKKSMAVEEQKASAKRKMLVQKASRSAVPAGATASSAAMQGDGFALVSDKNPHTPGCFKGGVRHNIRQTRSDAPYEERLAVCNWCADIIHRHICLVNAMCKGVVTDAKLKTTAIGLLYMMRQGIIVHELVVLPRLSCLEALLPLENHLGVFFGVKAKCITETENVVKIILRSVTKQQLLDAGVARIAFKL